MNTTPPASNAAPAAKGGITSLEELPYWSVGRTAVALPSGKYYAAADVERLLASTAGEQAEPNQQRKLIERAIVGLRDGWATRADADAALAALGSAWAAPAAPEQAQAVSVPRATLLMIYEAMNRMGDILNDMDACEDEDEEATTPAFDAIRALLDDSPFAAPIAAAPAAPEQSAPDIADKAMHWFAALSKCARLLDLPDDEPIPSGVVAAVERLVAAPAAEEVRNQALEDAAQICENEVPCSCCFSDDEVALAASLAAAIRAMKRAASTEGGA